MGFAEQVTLANDETFMERVQMAAVTAAKDICAEAVDNDHASYAAKRHNLAWSLINEPTAYVVRFAWAVASNPAINSSSSDSDIQYTVNSIWDAIAGVTTNEKP